MLTHITHRMIGRNATLVIHVYDNFLKKISTLTAYSLIPEHMVPVFAPVIQ